MFVVISLELRSGGCRSTPEHPPRYATGFFLYPFNGSSSLRVIIDSWCSVCVCIIIVYLTMYVCMHFEAKICTHHFLKDLANYRIEIQNVTKNGCTSEDH